MTTDLYVPSTISVLVVQYFVATIVAMKLIDFTDVSICLPVSGQGLDVARQLFETQICGYYLNFPTVIPSLLSPQLKHNNSQYLNNRGFKWRNFHVNFHVTVFL